MAGIPHLPIPESIEALYSSANGMWSFQANKTAPPRAPSGASQPHRLDLDGELAVGTAP